MMMKTKRKETKGQTNNRKGRICISLLLTTGMDWQGQGRKKREKRKEVTPLFNDVYTGRDTHSKITYRHSHTTRKQHATHQTHRKEIESIRWKRVWYANRVVHPPQCVLLTQISSHFLSPMHPIHQSPYTFFSVLELTTPISLSTKLIAQSTANFYCRSESGSTRTVDCT